MFSNACQKYAVKSNDHHDAENAFRQNTFFKK